MTPWTAACQAPLSLEILQARILEWVALPSSRAFSQPRDGTQFSCIAGRCFTVWATREAQYIFIDDYKISYFSMFINIFKYFCNGQLYFWNKIISEWVNERYWQRVCRWPNSIQFPLSSFSTRLDFWTFIFIPELSSFSKNPAKSVWLVLPLPLISDLPWYIVRFLILHHPPGDVWSL